MFSNFFNIGFYIFCSQNLKMIEKNEGLQYNYVYIYMQSRQFENIITSG